MYSEVSSGGVGLDAMMLLEETQNYVLNAPNQVILQTGRVLPIYEMRYIFFLDSYLLLQ